MVNQACGSLELLHVASPCKADNRSPGPLMLLQCGYTQILKLMLGLEHRNGDTWLNTPLHTSRQVECTACFLAQIKDFEYCPVHSSGQLNPDHLVHIVCIQDDNSTNLFVLGWIMSFSEHSKFWIFHVIRRNESARVVEHTDFVALPEEISILSPCSACTSTIAQNVLASQFNHLLEKWPFEDFRHLPDSNRW